MLIGIPKEVKVRENRVACTAGGVRQLVQAGHEVRVQRGAGIGSAISDEEYASAGALLYEDPADVWQSDMVVKVKEPMSEEYGYLREDLTLFTYLHLASSLELTEGLRRSGVSAIAYETIRMGDHLPLLEPMSEIAGRMSVIMGAYYLATPSAGVGGVDTKGKGVLLGGVPGVLPGKVVVLGGGTAGMNAARMATGLGADVTIMEIDIERMRFLESALHSPAHTLYSNERNLLDHLKECDLLVGAVLVPGARAPRLIKREFLSLMQSGSVFVDIAIDQGGCAETSKTTTHEDPVYEEEGVLHYCVGNMPGAYPHTATRALTNATFPYVLKLASAGLESLKESPGFASGLNVYQGNVVYPAVADSLQLPLEKNPYIQY